MRGKAHRGRLQGRGAASPTVDDYRAAQLALAMKREAEATQQAMRRAKMVDGLRGCAA